MSGTDWYNYTINWVEKSIADLFSYRDKFKEFVPIKKMYNNVEKERGGIRWKI